jgi:hypothetical protein
MDRNKGINVSFESGSEMVAYEIKKLMEISLEPEFSYYLKNTLEELKKDSLSSMALRKRVVANYLIYVERMQSLGEDVQPRYLKAVYGDMDAPEIKPSGSPYSNDICIVNPFDIDIPGQSGSDREPEEEKDYTDESDDLFESWVLANDNTSRIKFAKDFKTLYAFDPRNDYMDLIDEFGLVKGSDYDKVETMIFRFFKGDRFEKYIEHERSRIRRTKTNKLRDLVVFVAVCLVLLVWCLISALFT